MITHDIQRFSMHLAAMYANLAKPILDVILYNYQLAQNVGAEGLVILTVLIQSSSALRMFTALLASLNVDLHPVRALTPSFGTYTAQSAALAGTLRRGHSRLVEFAEEVAFLGGEETERTLLEKEFFALVQHEEKVMEKRWWYACAEEGIIKWLWGSFGVCNVFFFQSGRITHWIVFLKLAVCAIPVFFKLPGALNVDLGGRTEGL